MSGVQILQGAILFFTCFLDTIADVIWNKNNKMTLTFVKQNSEASKEGKKPVTPKGTPEKTEPFNVVEYLKGVKQEWNKVTWPSREQIMAETGIVIVVVAVFGFFIFLADILLQVLIRWIT